jgi:epoxyqueuosine reductase QueG
VGFATKTTLAGGPPTTDINYILPEGESAICFAIPLDKSKIRPFLRKELPRGRFDHVIDNGDGYLKAFKIAKIASDFLNEKGHLSIPVPPNFKYRPEVPEWRSLLPPVLALRLVAARSGVGSIGWSGNILVKGHGAPVLLGALVTSSKFEPTDPIPEEESPCDKCKLCVKVCAHRMFDKKEEDSYTLGGYSFTFSRRNNVVRCYSVCGGLTGLDKNQKWSTWSPGRIPYPETEEEADKAFAHMYSHPIKNMRVEGEEGSYAESKLKDETIVQEYISSGEVVKNTFNDDFMLTCGNCQLICWGDRNETNENFQLLTNSGCVVTLEDGSNRIISSEEADDLEKAGKITELRKAASNNSRLLEKYLVDLYKKLKKEHVNVS